MGVLADGVGVVQAQVGQQAGDARARDRQRVAVAAQLEADAAVIAQDLFR